MSSFFLSTTHPQLAAWESAETLRQPCGKANLALRGSIFTRLGPVRRLVTMKTPTLLACSLISAAALSSCMTTSLSDPNGSGHSKDLSLYDLTGSQAGSPVSEADVTRASNQGGSLPARGSRVLLVQSGAFQPDPQLVTAYAAHGTPVVWDGRNPEADSDKKSPARTGRQLRLAAAQQGCSHVVVVFGEIQSDSRSLPTAVVSWVPVVGELIPSEHSGTRLLAQAIILETRSPRYTLMSAQPREKQGITAGLTANGVNGRRSEKLKALAYPELAAKSFR